MLVPLEDKAPDILPPPSPTGLLNQGFSRGARVRTTGLAENPCMERSPNPDVYIHWGGISQSSLILCQTLEGFLAESST